MYKFTIVLLFIAVGLLSCKKPAGNDSTGRVRADEKPNPGFENGFAGWRRAGGATRDTAFVTAEAAKSGTAGLRVIDKNPADDVIVRSRRVPTVPGDRWKVTFQGRLDVGNGINVYARFLNTSGTQVGKPDDEPFHRGLPKDTQGWMPYEFEALAPVDAAAMEVYVRSNDVAIVTADFDDFTIEKIN
jgi:hypothetical protein